MSEYGFGDEELDLSAEESGQGGQQGGKGLRQYLDQISGELKGLREENASLRRERQKTEVADALKAKGYDPAAAGLYTGTPDKLDDWLTAHGGALARTAPEGGQAQEQQAPSGPPASTVPADSQEQMQRMMEQGTQGVAPPQGSDKELAAAIAAAQTPEEFAQIMKAHGSQFDWTQ
ncbi:hypothetical protein [Streptomyces tsukubensis]|uniref:hypothetical protein n=1 Tax=Streptomyces tsukubensis TaxID=83656 RepID=UPI00344D426A